MTSFPCPLLTSTQVLVDDADPRILYSPEWEPGGNPIYECEGTSHTANNTLNSTATFVFVGIRIEVFGTVGPNEGPPTSIYQVDDLPISTYTFPVNGGLNFRVPFYMSPLLELGNHTLTIGIEASSDQGQPEFCLDYIIYDSSGPASISSSLASSTSSSTPLSSPAPTLPTHSSSSINVAVASGVAGSLGGLIVGLCLAVIFLRFVYHKLRLKASQQEDSNNTSSLGIVTPIGPLTRDWDSATNIVQINDDSATLPPAYPAIDSILQRLSHDWN
ncbi:hypothetical protein C8R42DRAFT_722859 [Lentinula raphanica]|nr:hypothetical protein C8R42DRAFT_722859 [Lentinula raphanica]